MMVWLAKIDSVPRLIPARSANAFEHKPRALGRAAQMLL
jgi:hypothetical protein